MPTEDDDPVIASYNVFISPQPTLDPTNPSPKLYILQYPSHRPNTKPYSSSRSQKPHSLRIKPEAGIFEVDIPLFTSEHYNPSKGNEYGKAMQDSRQHNPYTSHGLSGGFSQNPPPDSRPTNISLSEISEHNGDSHNDSPDQLRTQTLGGKVAPTSDRNPVYMLATMNSQTHELHLTHLDAVVQLRPQLHHIDALEDQKRRTEAASKIKSNTTTNGVGPIAAANDPTAPVKLETKAIEMKLKDASKEDPNRSINMNAKLLREIQADRWLRHDWIERDEESYDPPIFTQSPPHTLSNNPSTDARGNKAKNTRLKSALDNDEWLNRMSSPGIELRTRLKGRDRERARRKRQERLRAAKNDPMTITENLTNLTNLTNPTNINTSGPTAAEDQRTRKLSETFPFAEGSASDTAATSDEDEDEEPNGIENVDVAMGPEQGQSQSQSQSRSRTQQVPTPASTSVPQSTPSTSTSISKSQIQIKSEPATAISEDVKVPQTSTTASAPVPKRRGRPPKK